jgi:hypothetical protein
MRNLRTKTFLLLAPLFFIILSCNDEGAKQGTITFSYTNTSAGNARVQETASKILVSIKNSGGELIKDKEEISLYSISGEYISEPLVLGVGNYTLEEFIVLNASNQVLYVAPKSGSTLAYLVNTPLAINFIVQTDQVTNLSPEVINAEGFAGVDFGYTTFGFNVVNTLKFLSAAFIYNETIDNLELIEHQLLVKSGDDTLYLGTNPNETVNTIVKSNYENYSFTFSKSGFISVERNYSKSTILSDFQTAPINVVLLPESIESGLLAFYPFNGNANDVSGNGFNGNVFGAELTTDKDGNTSSAYSFDGNDDYISIPHNVSFNFESSDFTISLWALTSEDQVAHGGLNDIIRKWNGNAEGYPYSISYRNSSLINSDTDKYIFAQYNSQTCAATNSSTSGLVNNSVFSHIVFLREGNTVKQYVDGTLVGEFNDLNGACTTNNTADVTIATRGNLVRFFKGKIDNVRFYSRALSQSEVASLFAGE